MGIKDTLTRHELKYRNMGIKEQDTLTRHELNRIINDLAAMREQMANPEGTIFKDEPDLYKRLVDNHTLGNYLKGYFTSSVESLQCKCEHVYNLLY